jgi:hypothetical protein
MFRSSGVQEFRSSGVQEFRSSGVQEFRSSGVQDGRFSVLSMKFWGSIFYLAVPGTSEVLAPTGGTAGSKSQTRSIYMI